MPYSGIPADKTDTMEACVTKVMAQGHDKSSAIAICHDSVMGKAVRKWSERHKKIDPDNPAQQRAAFARMDEEGRGGHKPGTRIFPQGKHEFASRITKRVPGGYHVRLDNDNPASAGRGEMFVPDKDVVLAPDDGSSGGGQKPGSGSGKKPDQHAPIVRRAIESGVTDVGQLSADEKRVLNNAVARGWLKKVFDYNYPISKPRWVVDMNYLQQLIDEGIVETPKAVKWSERRRALPVSAAPGFVVKEVGGQYRWVLISSNSYQDRDGEIVTQKALEDDVARADADGEYGPLLWWHEKSIVLGQCDYNAMHGRMLVESGTFKNAAIAQAFKQAAPTLGISIGFNHPISQPDSDGLFHTVRRFERSALPHTVASNPLTAIPIVEKETVMLKEKVEALRKVFGGDDNLVNSVIALADSQQKAADAAGIRTKEKDEEKPEGSTADAPPTGTDAAADKPFTKDEATDGEKPKGKEYLGDMDPEAFKHILSEVVDSRMTTLKAELQAQLDAQATTKATHDEATALALKAYNDKLDSIATAASQALEGVKELKGELPRALGERQKGWRASQEGDEPSAEHQKATAQPAADPMEKHWKAIQSLAGNPPAA